jgi:hypothetical protein
MAELVLGACRSGSNETGSGGEPAISAGQVAALAGRIRRAAEKVEKVCRRNGTVPSELGQVFTRVNQSISFQRPAWAMVRELEDFKWVSPAAVREVQWERARSLLRHAAATVPYYGRLLAEHGLTPEDLTPETFHKVQVLTKRTLRVQLPDGITSRALSRPRAIGPADDGELGGKPVPPVVRLDGPDGETLGLDRFQGNASSSAGRGVGPSSSPRRRGGRPGRGGRWLRRRCSSPGTPAGPVAALCRPG